MLLVFDVGHTNLRAAMYDDTSDTPRKVMRTSTPSDLKAALQTMHGLGSRMLEGTVPDIVAVAFPGPVAASGDLPICSDGSGGPMQASFRELAETMWAGAKVWLMNDVTAAGYHFVREGNADFTVTNVGSNIGQKIFLNGRPVVGRYGRGGEIGHWVVDTAPDAPLCDCGARGHLSAISSGRGTLALAVRRATADLEQYRRSDLAGLCPEPSGMDNGRLLQAFHSGDPWATDVIREAARPLAGVLAALYLALGLERFFLAGGFVTAAGPAYCRLMAEEAARRTWALGPDWTCMIAPLPTADDVVLSGAAYAARLQPSSDMGVVRLV